MPQATDALNANAQNVRVSTGVPYTHTSNLYARVSLQGAPSVHSAKKLPTTDCLAPVHKKASFAGKLFAEELNERHGKCESLRLGGIGVAKGELLCNLVLHAGAFGLGGRIWMNECHKVLCCKLTAN